VVLQPSQADLSRRLCKMLDCVFHITASFQRATQIEVRTRKIRPKAHGLDVLRLGGCPANSPSRSRTLPRLFRARAFCGRLATGSCQTSSSSDRRSCVGR
jgi:hypothetical protein